LTQDEFDQCKKNRWCFKCFSEGKKIVGSARFHPNHLTPVTSTSQGTSSFNKGKIAAIDSEEKGKEKDKKEAPPVYHTDLDSETEKSKN
jgi:hypothetical protein